MINGLTCNAEVPIHTMTYDTVQEWNFVGTAGGPGHPMHSHLWKQQICEYVALENTALIAVV